MSTSVIDVKSVAKELDGHFPQLSEDELRIALALYRSMASGNPVDVNTLVDGFLGAKYVYDNF